MNNVEVMKCPSCGGPVYFEDGQEYAFCSHCGCQVYKEDKHFADRIELEKHKVTESKNLAVAEMAHEDNKTKNDTIQTIILGVVVAIIIIAMLISGLT